MKHPKEIYYNQELAEASSTNGILPGVDGLLPIVDSTDHFTFACPRCKGQMKVFKVLYWPANEECKGGDAVLKIKMVCSKCRLGGQRKIYFNDGVTYPIGVITMTPIDRKENPEKYGV